MTQQQMFYKLKINLDDLLKTEKIVPVSYSWKEANTDGRRRALDILIKFYKKLDIETDYLGNSSTIVGDMGRHGNMVRDPLYGFLNYLKTDLGSAYLKPVASNRAVLRELKTALETNCYSYTNSLFARATYNINWQPGTYGEKTVSCYWGGRNGARAMIAKNKGFALQFFTDQEGKYPFGRCWGWYKPDLGLVLWNAYYQEGYSSTHKFYVKDSKWLTMYAAMLGNYFHLPSRRIVLKNNEEARGTLYINDGGYLIGPRTTIMRYEKVDLRWREITETMSCAYCRDIIFNQEEEVRAMNGTVACEDCAAKFFDICNFDHNIYINDELVTGPDKLKYYSENLPKVSKFCFHLELGKYMMRDKCRLVGTDKLEREIWLEATDTRMLCSECKTNLIPSTEVHCAGCKFTREMLEHKLSGEAFVFGSEGFSWKSKGKNPNSYSFKATVPVAAPITSGPARPRYYSPRFSTTSSSFDEEIGW